MDYYTDFIFEIESTSQLLVGQPTLAGGGRYNQMITELGGQETNCVGFALGIERLMVALKNNKILDKLITKYKKVKVYLAYIDHNKTRDDEQKIKSYCFKLINELTNHGISCICNFNINTKNIKKHFQYAENQCAQYIIIIGKKEIENDYLTIKDQTTMKQEQIKKDDIIKYFKNKKI